MGDSWPPSSVENWIEVLVVVDGPMVTYHGSKVRHYVLTLMRMVSHSDIEGRFYLAAQVDMIYRDKSVGNLIRVSVVKLILLNNDESFASPSRSESVSASEMLKSFCKWQKHLTSDKSYYDVALLLTRFGLKEGPLNSPLLCGQSLPDTCSKLQRRIKCLPSLYPAHTVSAYLSPFKGKHLSRPSDGPGELRHAGPGGACHHVQ